MRISDWSSDVCSSDLWNKTDGVVRMNIPGQPEIEVRIEEGRDNCRLCGIALIDNENGTLSMQRHMKFYESQRPFADDIGIFMQWQASRSEARRVGKEWVRTGQYRWAAYN